MVKGPPKPRPTPAPRPGRKKIKKGRKQMITLGRTYKDKITGFKGVATGFAAYISGCNQVLLAPPAGQDGGIIESQWYDEQRLIQVGKKIITLDNTKTPGFDKAAPKR